MKPKLLQQNGKGVMKKPTDPNRAVDIQVARIKATLEFYRALISCKKRFEEAMASLEYTVDRFALQVIDSRADFPNSTSVS